MECVDDKKLKELANRQRELNKPFVEFCEKLYKEHFNEEMPEWRKQWLLNCKDLHKRGMLIELKPGVFINAYF